MTPTVAKSAPVATPVSLRPLLEFPRIATLRSRRVKRTLDLSITALLFVIALPVICLISVAILIESGRPVFFRHQRVGRGGKPFSLWKFRTMVVEGDRVLAEHLAESPEAAEEWASNRKLRNDPRVVVMEETNARYVESLPEEVSLVVVDASFISLKILLPVVKRWVEASQEKEDGSQGEILALIKPQFEAGKKDVARGDGVIRNPAIHRQVLLDVAGFAQKEGFQVRGLIKSPLLGPKGNAEFLVWLGVTNPTELDSNELVERAVGSTGAEQGASNG